MLEFRPITEFPVGIISSLLLSSFADVMTPQIEESIRTCDMEAYADPDTMGRCFFVSVLDAVPVGMASWDPRQGPTRAIIGYNCIVPEFRKRGFGVLQMREVLSRLRSKNFTRAVVTTGPGDFYKSAVEMYKSCGFRESGRRQHGQTSSGLIDFEVDL